MSSSLVAEDVVRTSVAPDRRDEIRRYLSLFGYNPEDSVLEVYLAHAAAESGKDGEASSSNFVILGRTYDPVLGFDLIHPQKARPGVSRGYLGCLSTHLDENEKPPHEVLPLDFTPRELAYPEEWRSLYPPVELLVGMQIPEEASSTAEDVRAGLQARAEDLDVREGWDFLQDFEEQRRPGT